MSVELESGDDGAFGRTQGGGVGVQKDAAKALAYIYDLCTWAESRQS